MHEIRKVQNSPNKGISESCRRWPMGWDELPTMALKYAIGLSLCGLLAYSW